MRYIFPHCCLLRKIFKNYYFINKAVVYIDNDRPYHTAFTEYYSGVSFLTSDGLLDMIGTMISK